MKKLLLLFSTVSLVIISQAQTTYTSAAAGFFTNPTTWTPIGVPFPGDSIIINHAVGLNTDWGYSSGAIIINASGSLIQNVSNRAFATLGGGRLVNDGTFDVDSVGFFGGVVHNTGTFTTKTLYADVNSEGGLTTTDNMTIATDFWSKGNFTIGALATITVGGDFLHGDSTLSPALVCEGDFNVAGDFLNMDTIRGTTGQFCISGGSMNSGTMTGTVVVCDISGGNNVDLNVGTISGSVQGCAASTCVGIGIENISSITIQVYPNPATEFVQIKSEELVNVIVFDLMGKVIYQSTTASQIQNIAVNEWASGVYTYRVYSNKGMSTGKFIKQ